VGGRAEGEGGLKVRLASFGQTRSDPLGSAVKDYAARLSHYVQFELIQLPAQRAGRANANKSGEAAALFRKLRPRDWLVTLDESGKQLSSRDLSVFIAEAQNQSHDLLFAIGGDEGLSEEALKRSHLTLSLSRMTLPHRLARLVLIEQLYRAFTIHRGEPYHK
jgi:23S rRNA (pseudouridine1915-N3)-methyltransferase